MVVVVMGEVSRKAHFNPFHGIHSTLHHTPNRVSVPA